MSELIDLNSINFFGSFTKDIKEYKPDRWQPNIDASYGCDNIIRIGNDRFDKAYEYRKQYIQRYLNGNK